MKKMISVILIVAVLAASAFAAVYIAKRATMRLFIGRVEKTSADPTDGPVPKLTLKVDGIDVGQNADIHTTETIFPILTNVSGGATFGAPTSWVDECGKRPVDARKFVLTSEYADSENVELKFAVYGNTTIMQALRFGVTTKWYSEELGETWSAQIIGGRGETATEVAETIPTLLGDGTIAEGEEVEIYVSVWVDSTDLAEIGEYNEEDSFSIEAIFLA